MCTLPLLTGENVVHYRVVRPTAQTSALVTVVLVHCRSNSNRRQMILIKRAAAGILRCLQT